jgi:phage terminase large subunit-like protein
MTTELRPRERQLEEKLEEIWEYLSPEEQAEVDRLLQDHCRDPLKRVFDPAFKPVSWSYEYTKNEGELPGKLHAKQMAALAATGSYKHIFLFWGNQVGKTTLGAINIVLLALGRHPHLQRWEPPIVGWASALSWELWEKILLPEILTWIPPDRLISAPQAHKRSTNRDIFVRADNGRISRITGKAAEQGADKYQSARVHIVWTDEEHPESVWDEMQPRLLRHGGVTFNTMTPLKGLTWVYHRIYEPWKKGQRPDVFVSHAGLVDNPSVKAEEVQSLTRELSNNPTMLAARLHGFFMRPMGLVFPAWKQLERSYGKASRERVDAIRKLVHRGRIVAGLDFGLYRFAFLLGVADSAGVMHLVDEMFSQDEPLEIRAQKIHDMLTLYEVPAHEIVIAGDCANPTDILEVNVAFERLKSPYRVAAVEMNNKLIRPGVSRVLMLMNAQELLINEHLAESQLWYSGKTAEKTGKPVMGSRFKWELDNWRWPKTTETQPTQKDNPDDHSADGADMMAALRYLVMTWWFAKGAPDPTHKDEDKFSADRIRKSTDKVLDGGEESMKFTLGMQQIAEIVAPSGGDNYRYHVPHPYAGQPEDEE